MGLDGVELILDVEETFGISVPDEDLQRCHTAGQLHSLIVAKVGVISGRGCLTLRVFNSLREAITECFSHHCDEVSPSAKTDDLIPWENRREEWRRLAEALQLRLPALKRPSWLIIPLQWLSTFLGPLCFLLITGGINLEWLGLESVSSPGALILLTVVTFWLVLLPLTQPLQRHFSPNEKRFGGLVGSVLHLNLKALTQSSEDDTHPLSRADIWEVLCQLISLHLGVKREEIKPEARFIKDLGLS
jgi:acyl carrier protein